jgi:hypothetical protein
MFCMNCGKELPQDSKFCRYCGAAQQGGSQTQQVQPQIEPQWETCETYRTQVKEPGWSSQAQFMGIAEAIGPNGKYIAGHSPLYEGDDEIGFEPLIKQLTSEGWEYAGGFNLIKRFRRLVTPERLLTTEQRVKKEEQEAKELFDYIRKGRIKLELNNFGRLRVRRGKLKPETLTKVHELYPYIRQLIKNE